MEEYFEELMNEENERECRRVQEVRVVDQAVAKIGEADVRNILKKIKRRKTVGPDDVPVVVQKCL